MDLIDLMVVVLSLATQKVLGMGSWVTILTLWSEWGGRQDVGGAAWCHEQDGGLQSEAAFEP